MLKRLFRTVRGSTFKQFSIPALLMLAAFSSLWHVHVFNRRMPSTHSDLIQRWIGTRAALLGKDPYSPEVLHEIQTAYYGHPMTAEDEAIGRQNFLYPAPIVLILSVLAPLSWENARLVFMAVVSPLLGFSFWICFRFLHLSIPRMQVAVVLILTLFSWPVIWGLRLQQPTFLSIALIFIACYLLSRSRFISAGILLSISAFKPQIVIPLIAWLLLWAAVQGLWRFIASFAIASTILLLWTERIVPGWIPHWIASLTDYPEITKTALPLEILLGHWIGLALTLSIAGWCLVILWRLRRSNVASMDFGNAVSLALAATLLLIPTHLTMIYNQVLLFPASLLLIYRGKDEYAPVGRRFALTLLGIGLALPPVAVIAETIWGPRFILDGLPFWGNALLPPCIVLALASKQSAWMRDRQLIRSNAVSMTPST